MGTTNSQAAANQLVKLVTDMKAALKTGTGVTEALAIANVALTDLVPLLTEVPLSVPEAVTSPIEEAKIIFNLGLSLYTAFTT